MMNFKALLFGSANRPVSNLSVEVMVREPIQPTDGRKGLFDLQEAMLGLLCGDNVLCHNIRII